MSDTLYMQVDKNVEVHHPHVYLQDVVKLSCSNSKVLNRLRVMPVADLDPDKPGRYVMTVMDLIEAIQKKEENLDISPVGESDFVITYEKEKHMHKAWDWFKAVVLCVVSFFGTGFGIMTFNTDVSVKDLFSQLYELVTGNVSNGFTVLEITYSIGVGLGVLFFFNHFGKMKITTDPTPMQVKMRLYEDDVNTTITEDVNRRESQ
ncbi:MAG: stage V sporulation protein AA [Blautia sp.]|jgi:stage V sporulation protein AA